MIQYLSPVANESVSGIVSLPSRAGKTTRRLDYETASLGYSF